MRRSIKVPPAPKGLSKPAAGWWKQLHEEYELTDAAGLLLLEEALRAYDRCVQARMKIEKDGVVILDRFGQKKAHPATTVERDSRGQLMTALRQLQLDVEPLRDGPGRPGGGDRV